MKRILRKFFKKNKTSQRISLEESQERYDKFHQFRMLELKNQGIKERELFRG